MLQVDQWVESEQELAEQLPFQSERRYIPGAKNAFLEPFTM